MIPINSLTTSSLFKAFSISLIPGLFIAGLLYMVDWKMGEVNPLYYYIGLILIIAIIDTVGSVISYKRRKKKESNNKTT